MKTTKYLSFITAIALALFTAGCANEGTTDNGKAKDANTDNITFVGSMVSEPVKQEGRTRTSFDGTFPGTPGTDNVTFYWEVGDEIWLNNGAHTAADITAKNTNATFDFADKAGLGSEPLVYYPGKNAAAYNQVTIPTVQTQSAANSTTLLGQNGDCGVGKTEKIAPHKYKFTLKHKAAYLCFLPRSENGLVSTVVKSIKVTSDNNIAGTYILPDDENGTLSGAGSSKTITLNLTGCNLTNATTNQAANAAYMVIAPGTHSLTIEYTLYDTYTQFYYAPVRGTITKTVSGTFTPNTVTPITADLTVKDYSDRASEYYMWDAKKNFWYDANTGKQFADQPTVRNAKSENYPKNSSDERWFNPSKTIATQSCKDCPTFAAMTWYVMAGDPVGDHTHLWAYKGHLYLGGLWFKKWQNITGTDNHGRTKSTTVPYGDLQPEEEYRPLVYVPAKPFPATALWDSRQGELPGSEYFFLPCIGYMYLDDGRFDDIGETGEYWTSTPHSTGPYKDYDFANYLGFTHYGNGRSWIYCNLSMAPNKGFGRQTWTMK